ncbi:MAG: ankyrin repeat domain-containing protein [Polyangiaceae bacterium]|nr:ankyrin repeat domain-containing protein [Polyangiaceae bacterium]
MQKWEPWERAICELAQTADAARVEEALAGHEHVRPRVLSTALFYAAQNGHLETVEALLARGAKPNVLAGAGAKAAALEGTVRSARLDILKRLLEAGADPNLQTWSKESSPLMQAVADGKYDVARALIVAGASTARAHAPKTDVRTVAREMLNAVAHAPPERREEETRKRKTVFDLVDGFPGAGPSAETAAKKRMTKAFKPHARQSASVTFAKKDDAAFDESGTHLGGEPKLAPGESWPTCADCARPMIFRARVRLDDFSFLGRSGVVNLFDCIHLGAAKDAPPAAIARYRASDDGCAARAEDGAVIPRRPLSKVGKAAEEMPGPLLVGEGLPAFGAVAPLERAVAHDLSKDADKIGGWPWTPEELALPKCAVCSAPMALLLQLVSGGNIPNVVGSSHGRMFVFQCGEHPEGVEVVPQTSGW